MDNDLFLGKVTGRSVFVPGEVRDASARMADSLAAALGLSESETSMASYWSLDVRRDQWAGVLAALNRPSCTSLKFVEVGCGLGLFVVVGRLLGFDCCGVEAAESEYDGSVAMARRLLRSNGLPDDLVRCGRGEHLDFPERSFDVVCSFQALEHVENPLAVLKEAWRVLVPGGLLYLTCPNYLYPYEVHYGLMLPLPLGRAISALAVRLRGRSPGFLRSLNWTTPPRLRRWCADAGFEQVEIRSAGSMPSGAAVLDVVPAQLPYRFLRGQDESSRASRMVSAMPLRLWARRRETFPHIICCARRPL